MNISIWALLAFIFWMTAMQDLMRIARQGFGWFTGGCLVGSLAFTAIFMVMWARS